jgi:hypothetical protein
MAEQIPDEALVIRGGRNQPADLQRGNGMHPSGVTGVSVESAADKTIAELAEAIPHNQIGVATVGAVRAAVRTSGRSPYHATLTGLTSEAASALLTPTVPNPTRTAPQE